MKQDSNTATTWNPSCFSFESTPFRLANYIRLKLPFGLTSNVNTRFCFVCHRLLAWPFPVYWLMFRGSFFYHFIINRTENNNLWHFVSLPFFFHWSQVHKKTKQNKMKSKQVHPSWLKSYRLVPRCLPLKLKKASLSPESDLKPPSGFVDKYIFP